MKPENTIQNKAAFFALYWGQDVVKSGNPADQRTYNVEGANLEDEYFDSRIKVIESSFLGLKPLSRISDEDLLKVYHVSNGIIGYDNTMDSAGFLVTAKHLLKVEGEKSLNKYSRCTDFLRSRGYALPWMGLSVEELVEYGWVKLKEVEK